MTTKEIKSEIQKSLDNVPESVLQDILNFLKRAEKQPGFVNVKSQVINAPVVMPSAKDCVRFEYESFAALHQMLDGLSATEKAEAWEEIESELSKFEDENGFSGPCEFVVGVGQKPVE